MKHLKYAESFVLIKTYFKDIPRIVTATMMAFVGKVVVGIGETRRILFKPYFKICLSRVALYAKDTDIGSISQTVKNLFLR